MLEIVCQPSTHTVAVKFIVGDSLFGLNIGNSTVKLLPRDLKAFRHSLLKVIVLHLFILLFFRSY